MPRRTSKPTPAPATSSKKPRMKGVNLRDLGLAISTETLTESLQVLATEAAPAQVPGREDPQYNQWRFGRRALETVLVSAAGGDPAMAKGLIAELAQKVGVPMGGGVEDVVCDRLRDFLADLKVENKPESHTLRLSLLAAVCDTDDTERCDNKAGVIRQKGYAHQSLHAVAVRLGVKDEAMYKAKRRRLSWEGGMPWLASVQPQATNHKALGREEREAIRWASTTPEISHPSACMKWQSNVKGKRSPYLFMNASVSETCDAIRAATGLDLSDLTIKRYMDPQVRADNRLFTGLCIIHHGWRLQWGSLGDWIAEEFCPTPDCECAMCSGDYQHPDVRAMLLQAVCPPQESTLPTAPGTMMRHFPHPNCILGDCAACGWAKVVPPCPSFPPDDGLIQYQAYRRVDVPTRGGGVFKKTELQPVDASLKNLLVNMQESLPEFTRHHYYDGWIAGQLRLLTTNPPKGWLVMRWDFPQKFELEHKASVSEEFYYKAKILVLICCMTWADVSGRVENHAHFFVTDGDMKKCPSLIHHCMDIAIRWAKGRGGVTTIVHSSDRCRAEFSNGTHLLHLARSSVRHKADSYHLYSMEHEGKGPNDALGLVVRVLLKSARQAGHDPMNAAEVCKVLHQRTQGKPIKGKYSSFQQYVWHHVDPDRVVSVDAGKSVPGITKVYAFLACKKGDQIQKRTLPCFCPKCQAKKWDQCPNLTMTQPWDTARVGVKGASQATQDSDASSSDGEYL